MTITSKPLAIIVLLAILGGIAFSSVMGWWVTESTKVPATFTEGEFAGQANPADIRGSYTFGDIANAFAVTPEILAQAFGVTVDNPAAFAVKDLEGLYADSGYEIGTASVRLFVAFYTGVPYDLSAETSYLPRSASDILLALGTLSPDQVAYLDTYTVDLGGPTAETEAAPAQPVATEAVSVSTPEASAVDYTIKGKTTFGELLSWGVPQAVIEQIIGGPLPDPAMTLKDYVSAHGLDMETIKTALQAEVNKLHP
jgi:hypothetical protein